MKTKLTLSIDKDLADFAHQQAKREGGSISGMFSKYLKERKTRQEADELPVVAEMAASLKKYSVQIDDSKEAIRNLYAKKYLD